jgi:hypothetical protein
MTRSADFRAALERLDEKLGRVHTQADCAVAYRKSINTPELVAAERLTI